jgi:hypothetical protein
VSDWDDFLALTHPGREVEIPTTGERWLIMRRSYRSDSADPDLRDNYLTVTVELVRSGSAVDPRRLPPDAPRPPNPEEDRHGR